MGTALETIIDITLFIGFLALPLIPIALFLIFAQLKKMRKDFKEYISNM